MASVQTTESVISKLPLRLRNFFARYPPQIYSAAVAPRPQLPPADPTTTPTTDSATPASDPSSSSATSLPSSSSSSSESQSQPSPYIPNRDAKGHKRPDPSIFSPSRALLHSDKEHPNPFLPRKNFRTGTWIGPAIGLRRQAELVKLAIKYDVEELLPPGRKSTEYKETRRLERGLQIKGTGIGQKVKGHQWERTMESKLEERRKAMMEMPELIRAWKQRGHGRGWKHWPKK